MNLIANSGIQFFSTPIEINLNDNFKMFFHESFDLGSEQLKLEIAHYFAEDDIWVNKREIFNLLGLGLTNGKVGRIEDGNFKPYKWEEIVNDFYAEGYKNFTPMESEDTGTDSFSISPNRFKWEKFENQWLPLPYFSLNSNSKTEFGPTNWCRFKLVPTSISGNTRKYDLLLVFDTRTKYEEESFEDADLMEIPVFSSSYEKSKVFAICNNEFSLVDFCSKSPYNCDWVDEHILNLFHDVRSIDDLKIKKPRLNYLAQFIFIIKYIQELNVLPEITLYSNKNVVYGDVDLVIDIGNSRTCAVLFDDHDFTKVESLGLQNLSNPLKKGELNIQRDSFDMRLAFFKADFGIDTLKESMQFVFPSLVRLGKEANELIHRAINLNTGVERISTFSSPKRYLWDDTPKQKDWEFLSLKNDENSRLVYIKGISEQLQSDGSLNTSGNGKINHYYSRKALMTFSILEMLAQANMQINSYAFRHKWGDENKPRRIDRIILTCPTAMSKREQKALRKCAEDAAIILDRFYSSKHCEEIDEKEARKNAHVIPSLKNLSNNGERKEWIYDEPTSTQFVYLFAELSKRYRNNCEEYFDFYGKTRKDLGDYNKKSLTIGAVDMGAGTTDLMIASYKYDDSGQCNLTPVPLFYESFYIAGDDLMKNLIQRIIIEGDFGAIQKHLELLKSEDIATQILNFFGEDNSLKDITARQVRSDFNLQVSVHVIQKFLQLLNEYKVDKTTLSFNDIFENERPTDRVLEHFRSHFGFPLEDLNWVYDKAVISKIVESTFDALIGKISTVLSYYGCDVVLLSGRPTSLRPLSDLFLKYYAITPNRLITLNEYRVGTWYPFQDGKGYFKDAKSIVAVGAMIGNFASSRGSLNGFSLDLSELIEKTLPTSEYFSKTENDTAFLSPETNNAKIIISQLPARIWTRQLNTPKYPTRPFYILTFNEEKIKERMLNKLNINQDDTKSIMDETIKEIERIRKLAPFTFNIIRENYNEDREALKIESVHDRNQEELPELYFSLQIQSMNELDNYWLDSGAFENLQINNN